MLRYRTTCVLVLLALACTRPSMAQTTGDISGRALDTSGAVLPGATVTVCSQATDVAQTTVTSETGAFRFAGLVPGGYRVQVELVGFKTLVLDEVRVLLGQTTDVQPRLELSQIRFGVRARF